MNLLQAAEYLRETHGLDPRWEAHSFEVLRNGVMIRGRIVDAVFKRGPRKGKPNWRACKTLDSAFSVRTEDYEEWIAKREEQRGICKQCAGRGKLFARWSKASGVEHKPCPRCAAKGESNA